MIPAASRPGIYGKGVLAANSPRRREMSVKLSPATSVLISTWLEFGTGFSISSSLRFSAPPNSYTLIAFIPTPLTLNLTDPAFVGLLPPPISDGFKFFRRQVSFRHIFGIFTPTARFCRAHDRRRHALDRQRKTQRRRDRLFRALLQKRVFQFLNSFPIIMVIRILRFLFTQPDCIGDRAFGDHADVALFGGRYGQFDRLLIGDVNRRLQRLEKVHFGGIFGIETVTRIPG